MHETEQEIASIEAERAEALVQADIGKLQAITADDYVHVEANGRLRDKAGFLNAMRADGLRFSSYDLADNLIRVFGETAVVTGVFTNEMVRPDGEHVGRTGRHCRVYVRQADGWRNVLHQATEVAD